MNHDRLYGAAWRKLRLRILARDGYECKIRLPGCTVKATQVDHIIPLEQGGAVLDPSNVRAACGFCNASRAAGGRVARKTRPSREW